MTGFRIRAGKSSDSKGFLSLLLALADFERLEPPDEEARRRIVRDIFEKKKVNLFVASSGKRLVGYALYFYTYSSFLARQTLYLEDIYVDAKFRQKGIGQALLMRCVKEAERKGCGRMEWAVLTWNKNAIRLYERIGAERMVEWHTYRLDSDALRTLSG